MQKKTSPKPAPQKPRNYGPVIKIVSWGILILSIVYAVAGDNPGRPGVVIFTVLAGVLICTIGMPWVKMSIQEREQRKELDKVIVGWLMIGYMVVNAGIIAYHSTQPLSSFSHDAGDWIANRFLYLFGLAFFLPAIVEPKLRKSSAWRTCALIVAGLVMFVGFCWAYGERLEECQPPGMWYTVAMLIDDSTLSVAIGLFVSVFVTVQQSKRHNIQ